MAYPGKLVRSLVILIDVYWRGYMKVNELNVSVFGLYIQIVI